ncbi:MAG: invasion associated locus B family protein [Caulobacteraceae bacterium]|nr:invasion associated locus B family protein [Caulobacter sp.]
MSKKLLHVVVALWAATIAVSTSATADQALTAPVAVKPPDMILPPGLKPGAFRRIIQPFGVWTLICDENLTSHTRLCNVSQTLVDATGKTVFSWSLAASQAGAPIFIVRLPAALAGDHFVQIVFGGKAPGEAGVILDTCGAAVCLGYLDVDAKIRRHIAAKAKVAVKVRIGARVETFDTTLDGLEPAVASLK